MRSDDPRDAVPDENRVDLVYNAKWRRTLLATVPLGALAFMVAWYLEEPSGQATGFDLLLYPLLACCLLILEIVLLRSANSLRRFVLSVTGGVSLFFVAKLYLLLFVLPSAANAQAQLTENMFWIPVIYLLSFVLPDSHLGRRLSLAYTAVVLALSLAYLTRSVMLDQGWGMVYALIQMNLANCVLFALTSSFILFKDEYTRSQTRVEVAERFATTDQLTGAANRRGLQRMLDRRFGIGSGRFGLLFIDVDGFKSVNDSLGHAGGDELLDQIARRLRSVLSENDFLARFSGDEFIVVVDAPDAPQRVTVVAQRAVALLTQPFTIQGREVAISASVGISFYPSDGQDAETLIRQADSAMYRVKRSGRNGMQHFHSELDLPRRNPMMGPVADVELQAR